LAVKAALLLFGALALIPLSHHSASLDLSTTDYAPSTGLLTINGSIDRPALLGVRLAAGSGSVLGWIDAPKRRSEVSADWDGTLAGRKVAQGAYQAQLVANGRVVARADFRIDRTAAQLLHLRVTTNSEPFAGDNNLLATVTPNHDGLRDYARVSFDLSEDATVTLNVQRTDIVATVATLSTQTWKFKAGHHAIGWLPPSTTPARTYVLSLTTVDAAGNTLTYGSPDARVGRHPRAPVVRIMGIDAATTQQSYAPGQTATVVVSTDEPRVSMQILQTGPEHLITYSDQILEGIPTGDATILDWSQWLDKPRSITFKVGDDWPSGLYFVKFAAADATLGYAPFVVRPAALGVASRVAVILPTNSWQAYNFYDANGDGWGDTWYAGFPNTGVVLNRPFLHRGVPPFFYRYDQGFLHWLYWNKHTVDFLAESDLDKLNGDDLARDYDLVVYSGHSEYVTTHEYDVIERYRNLGGNLIFLSANNFFWHVAKNGMTISRDHQWRHLGRPEAGLIGVQYLANDRGTHQGLFQVTDPEAVPWLWQGTGLTEGSTIGAAVGGYGIEIDHTAAASPPGTLVVAQIPDLFGPGLTAQMSYYETAAGAKVFAAGALDFGGSALTDPVSAMLTNLWARLSKP
jgi:hypothetical protein